MISIKTGPIVLAASVSLLTATQFSHAQEGNAPISTEPQAFEANDGTVIYPASFFSPYNPVSVSDMLDRIPGVSVGGGGRGGGGRGLGTGGDVLINGQRMAGKENSPRDQLDRIAAQQVERIEIIRGTSAELDVRGSDQVVNVVLAGGNNRSSTTVEVVGRWNHDQTAEAGASVAHSRQIGNFQGLINIEARPNYENRESTEIQYDPAGQQIGSLFESNIRDQDVLEVAGNIGYQWENQRVQLNMLYGDSGYPRRVSRDFSDYLEYEQTDNDHSNWEVGGDYDVSLANGHRAQLLFVATDQTRDEQRERFRAAPDTAQVADDSNKALFIDSDQRTRERIVQGNYSFPLVAGQNLRVGLERAVTRLDSSLLVGSRQTGSGSLPPSDRYGGLSPQPALSNAGTTVEEVRYEGFAFHNWDLGPRSALESSLVYETSEISQSGVVDNSRRFTYLRPSIDYRFNFTESLQLRATLAKEVSQLSFSSFAATVNDDDREQNTDAGNPELAPQEELRYELGLEYRLPNDSGVVNSRIFYRDIKNFIGTINATVDPDKPLSAEGNVGPATRWGIFNDASLRLGFLGLPDAIISAEVNIFDSEITNPFLGTKERINRRGGAELGFRHDVTAWALSYGFDYRYPFHGGEYNIDVTTITRNDGQPSLEIFVSRVFFDDVTVRLESDNTLDQSQCRTRFRYSPSTIDGELSRIEDSCSSRYRRLILSVSSTF